MHLFLSSRPKYFKYPKYMLKNEKTNKKQKQTNKQTNQLHGCLKLEEVFYLLQNTAPNSKAVAMLRRYACQNGSPLWYLLLLIGFDCYGKP